ncbi:hypothetical protein GKE82_12755 [Conexibacter sp. W3-3-2]|uniref:DUF3817 domain-containing protein n=1 Tax=Paraconexibacter algicola TaxID=2133960 RepID=A0A2T4UHY6_9ACTN|nr:MULTISPECIES: DUF3817 domain-containing protein [Solirubrobacterales]MTD45139.1 hypothetical protein [Conexibacter sp. W3-3-2]PTL58829.1 hypothetical protein C7Y72_03765 [Paraconexibacter algicola]
MPDRAVVLKKLDVVRWVALADFLLLLVLLYASVIADSDSAVSILGPIHGIGFLVQLYLVAVGAGEKLWGWWFLGAVVITGGPLGALLGDLKIRRDLAAA